MAAPALSLLFLSLLAAASAQIPSLGWCPDYQPMANFNMNRFLGQWHEAERYFTVTELGSRCVTTTYEKMPDGRVWVSNEIRNTFTGVKRVLDGQLQVVGRDGEGKLSVKYTSLPVPYDTQYSVLDTDYDNFAVIWSCSGIGPVHTQNAWVMTRERLAPGLVLQRAYGVLDKYKISRAFFVKTNQEDCTVQPEPIPAVDPKPSSAPADPAVSTTASTPVSTAAPTPDQKSLSLAKSVGLDSAHSPQPEKKEEVQVHPKKEVFHDEKIEKPVPVPAAVVPVTIPEHILSAVDPEKPTAIAANPVEAPKPKPVKPEEPVHKVEPESAIKVKKAEEIPAVPAPSEAVKPIVKVAAEVHPVAKPAKPAKPEADAPAPAAAVVPVPVPVPAAEPKPAEQPKPVELPEKPQADAPKPAAEADKPAAQDKPAKQELKKGDYKKVDKHVERKNPKPTAEVSKVEP